MFLVFNSALKELDDTPQPNSEVGDRWIVVKVSDLKKASSSSRSCALGLLLASAITSEHFNHSLISYWTVCFNI